MSRLREAGARLKQRLDEAGLTQKELQEHLGIKSRSTVSVWFNPKRLTHAPTERRAIAIDRLLQERSPDTYEAGDVLHDYGWRDGAAQGVEGLSRGGLHRHLRDAGFRVPDRHLDRLPAAALWAHRLREVYLVHGVFALAAAAYLRAGVPVHLALDDMEVPENDRRLLLDDFESNVRNIVKMAGADDSALVVSTYSSVLGSHDARVWPLVRGFLAKETGLDIPDFLLASKVVPLTLFSVNEREALAHMATEKRSVDRLLITFYNLCVFDLLLGEMLEAIDDEARIVTLGGKDEKPLWDCWGAGSSLAARSRVRHAYLERMPCLDDRAPWNYYELRLHMMSETDLAEFIHEQCEGAKDQSMAKWIHAAAVRLPAALLSQVDGPLGVVPIDDEAFKRELADDPRATYRKLAEAVMTWCQ